MATDPSNIEQHFDVAATSVAPRGVLRLSIREIPWGRGYEWLPHPAACARLRIDYGGHRVSPSFQKRTTLQTDTGNVVIERNAVAEAAIADRLDGLGMVSLTEYLERFRLRAAETDVDVGDLLNQPDPRKPPLPPQQWQALIDVLTAEGFIIEFAPEFPSDRVTEIDTWHGDLVDSGQAWFDLALGIDVDGERVDLLPVLRRVISDPQFSLSAKAGERADASIAVSLDDQRKVRLSLARLRTLIEPLLEWLQVEPKGSLRIHRTALPQLDRLEDVQLIWSGASRLQDRLPELRALPKRTEEPEGFTATLRDYQREGLAWLAFLSDAGLGGILADDMGLGKTVQVLAHIVDEKQRGRLPHPVLVVAPTSLIGNWCDETARFAPRLRVLVLHGSARSSRYAAIDEHDLIITTYPLLSRDRTRLLGAKFSLLVLDEAQAIKNARSLAAQVVRDIPATRRLAMTGTPLENHLGELWAQFDAVEPGLLGSSRQFTRFFRNPIEKHGDLERQQRLKRRIGPLLLRRRKEDVLSELPPKTEMVHRLDLAPGQRELYETLRLAQHERVRDAIRERGLGQSGIIVLDALLKLRQVCCDPRLVKLESARRTRSSAKLDALLGMLARLVDEGRRVLVFSQFTEMLDLIAPAIADIGISYLMLTGQTPATERSERVRQFQDGAAPVFLVSLKAGGTGLNLTAADTVIHYDPWWNPAVETQATDRAHRIGQDKPVFVYKLICTGTVEEKIQALQSRKSNLSTAILDAGATQKLSLDEADLAELFAPMTP
ncbi:MAG: DEAD/DEAH box helicase [Dokdonella sp.]